MRAHRFLLILVYLAFCLALAPVQVWAEPGNEEAEPAVSEWVDSDANKNYQPKSDVEGEAWVSDPAKVKLNEGVSSTGTNFTGARILKGNVDVEVLGEVGQGVYEDEDRERYSYWEGSTLYFGVKNPQTTNTRNT
jgi:hypothetical protein